MNKESERMAVIKIKGFTYKFAWLYFEDLSSNLPCANSLIIEFLNLLKIFFNNCFSLEKIIFFKEFKSSTVCDTPLLILQAKIIDAGAEIIRNIKYEPLPKKAQINIGRTNSIFLKKIKKVYSTVEDLQHCRNRCNSSKIFSETINIEVNIQLKIEFDPNKKVIKGIEIPI